MCVCVKSHKNYASGRTTNERSGPRNRRTVANQTTPLFSGPDIVFVVVVVVIVVRTAFALLTRSVKFIYIMLTASAAAAARKCLCARPAAGFGRRAPAAPAERAGSNMYYSKSATIAFAKETSKSQSD